MADYTDEELQTQFQTVRANRVRGVRSKQFGDRSVTYMSDQESRAVEKDILRERAARNSRPRQVIGIASKGLT